MITVEDAEQIIAARVADYGTEIVHFLDASGRVLAEPILADRDIPAGNKATMDGIAISFEVFERGQRAFAVKAIQAAGDMPVDVTDDGDCVEIMTGASLSDTVDTVVRYEDVVIKDGVAAIEVDAIRKSQNIHRKGADKKTGDIVVPAGSIITPAVIGAAAFTGKETLLVKKQPKVVIISNGDELMEVSASPPPYKIRRSNSYTIKATLLQLNIDADLLHLPDEEIKIEAELKDCLAAYDAIILSGGVSMGKFDFLPAALAGLSVEKMFHKVQQKPGKPFWFGIHPRGARVFAFPGNPVSTFMCLYRYFVPWYKACMGLKVEERFAVLADDFNFEPQLQCFVQVKLRMDESAKWIATPVPGNGSGDLANLVEADAFMELPLKINTFKKGDTYRVWPFKTTFN